MLDSHGKLAVAELCVYPIVFLLTVTNLIWVPRNGKRDTAWIYITLFCAFRIIGPATVIHMETTHDTSTAIYIVASITNGLALSPLLLAGVGFATTCSDHLDDNPRPRQFLLLGAHLFNTVAIVISIVGATKMTPPYKQDELTTAASLIKAAPPLYLVAVACLGAAVMMQWRSRYSINIAGGAKILLAVLISIPFLVIRIIYVFLSNYSTHAAPPTTYENKYNVLTGQWGYYFGLALVMEFCVVTIYVATGISIHRFGRGTGSNERGKSSGDVESA